jgi:hypothetical protein
MERCESLNAKLIREHRISIHKLNDCIMERMEMLLFFTTKHLKRRILSKYDIPMSYISSIELTQVNFLSYLSLSMHLY